MTAVSSSPFQLLERFIPIFQLRAHRLENPFSEVTCVAYLEDHGNDWISGGLGEDTITYGAGTDKAHVGHGDTVSAAGGVEPPQRGFEARRKQDRTR